MYDELVKRLRNAAQWAYKGLVTPSICLEAAEAIEDLENRLNLWRHDKISRWIPATEPPKEDGWYQVYAPEYSGGSSSGLKNINGNMYSAFKHGKWSIEVGYHKRPGCVKAWMPLPEPPKEVNT